MRRTEKAQRLCRSDSVAGRVGVEVDFAGIAGVEEAAARAVSVGLLLAVSLPDGHRRGSTRRLHRDLEVPRRADVGVGRAENVIACTRMRNRAWASTS
jgi:hypothetical protein